jgi:ATP-dependent Clp protease ATP-binding subunit ClpA
MFERFTTDARTVVVAAQVEARRLGHDWIGTEHVLIALLTDPAGAVARSLAADGIDADHVRGEAVTRIGPRSPDTASEATEQADAEALKAIGIDLEEVRKAIEANFGAGALRLPREDAPKKRGPFAKFYATSGHLPFTNRNKKILELALREALSLGQKFIAPEHLMLGLLREGQGMAATILADRQVDVQRVRAELTAALRTRAA